MASIIERWEKGKARQSRAVTSDELAPMMTARLAGRPSPSQFAAFNREAIAALLMCGSADNPSRRALLGAAVALPLVGGKVAAESALRPLHHSPAANGPPPRSGEDLWRRLLAEFRAAEAAVRECERRTAGAPWAQQAAIEEEYGDRLDALYDALRRLLLAPAPDLAALAMKIELAIEHEVVTLNGGEACLAAIQGDARRLAAAYPGL